MNHFIKENNDEFHIYINLIRPYIKWKTGGSGQGSLDKYNRAKVTLRNHTQKEIENLEKKDQNLYDKYPINHREAENLLKNFIKNKLKYFAKYQDSINKNLNVIYHSFLSQSMNMCLLSARQCLKAMDKIINKYFGGDAKYDFEDDEVRKILDGYEAFMRQLFWREY